MKTTGFKGNVSAVAVQADFLAALVASKNANTVLRLVALVALEADVNGVATFEPHEIRNRLNVGPNEGADIEVVRRTIERGYISGDSTLSRITLNESMVTRWFHEEGEAA